MIIDSTLSNGLVEEKEGSSSAPPSPRAPGVEAEVQEPSTSQQSGPPMPPEPQERSRWEFEPGDIVDVIRESVSSYEKEIVRPAVRAFCQFADLPTGVAEFVEAPLAISLLLTTLYSISSMIIITFKLGATLLPAIGYQLLVHATRFLWSALGMTSMSIFLLITMSMTLIAIKAMMKGWISPRPQIQSTIRNLEARNWAAMSTDTWAVLTWMFINVQCWVRVVKDNRRARSRERWEHKIIFLKFASKIAWAVLLTSGQVLLWIGRKGIGSARTTTPQN